MGRYAAFLLLLSVLPSVAACSIFTAPEPPWRPPDAVPYEPPAIYATWWAEVTACLGMPDDGFERIAWYRVGDGYGFSTPDYGRASGRWVPPHEVYIAFRHTRTRYIVKHEMIHELLRGGSHDDPRFACARA
ncbi:MAG TPA: hypothetical protein VFQ22_06720 [Longimicrobiales bacterium]|nr:hypothetical protein [Longimicrobiales bacterium]